ncbi:MAG TPA: ankyrin repeat domain-containing protein, partial [Anaeromyxobacter sp.]|nr:ankyrin repeat domain-containing protein [Anaeromyxobacter sp.]
VDAAGPDGRTPLMFAAMFDRVEVVELLLRRGASADLREAGAATALDLARAMGAARAARLLE